MYTNSITIKDFSINLVPGQSIITGDTVGYTISTEEFVKESFSVYPSVTSGPLYIDCNSSSVYSLKIFNVLGEMVLRQDYNTGTTNLNIEGMPEGLYFLKFEDGNYTSP